MLYRRFFLLLMGMMIWSLPVSQAQESTYTGVDILFLVDQSGSMSGQGFDGQIASDPNGLRFAAVQYAVETLAAYRQTLAPELEIQMNVIAFGSEALPVLDWTPIAEPGQPWEEQAAALHNQLSQETFNTLIPGGQTHLGNTNFIAAYQSAQAAFDRLPPSSDHLRVIIILTDGNPCVDEGEYQFTCGSLAGELTFMEVVQQTTSETFPPPQYELYALVLDSSGDLWAKWNTTWAEIVRIPENTSRVSDSQQIGVLFLQILRRLISQVEGGLSEDSLITLNPGENQVEIPPYQRLMRLSIFKSSASPGLLTITLPDGTPLEEGDPRLDSGDRNRPIEIWTMTSPPPGEWIFTLGSTADRIDVSLELIPIEVQAALSDQNISRYDTVTVRLTTTDDAGNPLPSYAPPYDLQVESTVTLAGGSSQQITLQEVSDGVYEGKIAVEQAGVYQVAVKAVTQFPDGTPYVIYEDENVDSFNASDIVLQVDGLPAGDYLLGNEITVNAQLVDEQGNILSPPEVALTGELGGEAVAFAAQPDGSFQALLPFTEAGQFTLLVKAQFQTNEGQVKTLEQSSSLFEVLPSEFVQLEILAPQPDSETYSTEGLFFETTDVTATFETRLADSGQPIDLLSIAQTPADILTITLKKPEGKSETLTEVQSTDRTGVYQIHLGQLPVGDYTLVIQAKGALTERYVLDPATTTQQVAFSRKRNLTTYGLWGGILLAGLVSIGLLASGIRRQRLRRHHPARGKLIIAKSQDFGADVTWLRTIDLNRYNSNHIVIKGRLLPREVHLSRLLVVCENEEMYKKKQVRISAWRGRELVVDQKLLSPLSVVKISGKKQKDSLEQVTYQLMKDPDEY